MTATSHQSFNHRVEGINVIIIRIRSLRELTRSSLRSAGFVLCLIMVKEIFDNYTDLNHSQVVILSTKKTDKNRMVSTISWSADASVTLPYGDAGPAQDDLQPEVKGIDGKQAVGSGGKSSVWSSFTRERRQKPSFVVILRPTYEGIPQRTDQPAGRTIWGYGWRLMRQPYVKHLKRLDSSVPGYHHREVNRVVHPPSNSWVHPL